MSMIKKHLNKDISLQKKDKISLMNLDQYNDIIMKYKKIISFLDNTVNQPTKFRIKSWVKINVKTQERYDEVNQISRHFSHVTKSCIFKNLN